MEIRTGLRSQTDHQSLYTRIIQKVFMSSLPNIAILGDYERALRRFSNWEKLEKQANLSFHHEPLRDEALYEVVKDADAIAIVRDRAPFNEAMIEIGRAHV
mgnify:FL=1